ncbi:major facilitator superfamily protein [Oxobacter pfennigii]|uniref:Major facilitator superfamily protein n=1 Tax=Oxobacter pfennigii TaxID=36849 RepID=A0A0N8NTC4_9CLOT|nr:MFS transporter [Oxobacter pfennigii]KPU44440.1 major facilitator superfamily protein [Oxobacter pfennigii]
MKKQTTNTNRSVFIYLCIIALIALANGLSASVLSNYFKDAYSVTTYQRGFIEIPREFPGILSLFIVTGLSFLSDIRIAMIAQVLSIIGITVLGLLTPPYGVMLFFIFINSMGEHLTLPLQDSIGMSLIKDGNVGKRMGQYKGISTGFAMLSSVLVFMGFRMGFFSFTAKIKWIFIIAAVCFSLVMVLLSVLERVNKDPIKQSRKIEFIFRKEYRYYYILVIMFGLQKQMMLVYGPWVLIELLSKKADTLAILGIIGSFAGIFFIPAVGRWLDRFGIKKLLYIDALSYIGVYLIYGLLCAGFISNTFGRAGLPVLFVYLLFILDKMSIQMGLVRTVYLKSILVKESDLRPSLTLGQSMDHFVSITCAFLGGIVWSMVGAQYLFFIVAALSCINLYVAIKVKDDAPAASLQAVVK